MLNDGKPRRVTYLPPGLGYAVTLPLQKVQGLTLEHITLWLDVPKVEAAYVAFVEVAVRRQLALSRPRDSSAASHPCLRRLRADRSGSPSSP